MIVKEPVNRDVMIRIRIECDIHAYSNEYSDDDDNNDDVMMRMT